MTKRTMPLSANDTARTRAMVIGSSGAIGGALALELASRGFCVTSLSRSPTMESGEQHIDITSAASVEEAAARLIDLAPFALILVATGLLHDARIAPEKALRDVNQASLTRLFAVNAIGPALIAKHFVPLLPKQGRCHFAVLSARVGSISDNRLGGWYGYRASKAALNMIVKTLSIELARTHPEAICVSLHPGTVDSPLSGPFQKSISAERLFSPAVAAEALLKILDQLTPAQSGRCFAWDGVEVGP